MIFISCEPRIGATRFFSVGVAAHSSCIQYLLFQEDALFFQTKTAIWFLRPIFKFGGKKQGEIPKRDLDEIRLSSFKQRIEFDTVALFKGVCRARRNYGTE